MNHWSFTCRGDTHRPSSVKSFICQIFLEGACSPPLSGSSGGGRGPPVIGLVAIAAVTAATVAAPDVVAGTSFVRGDGGGGGDGSNSVSTAAAAAMRWAVP